MVFVHNKVKRNIMNATWQFLSMYIYFSLIFFVGFQGLYIINMIEIEKRYVYIEAENEGQYTYH